MLTTEQCHRTSACWRGRSSREGTVGDAQRKRRHAGAPSSVGRPARGNRKGTGGRVTAHGGCTGTSPLSACSLGGPEAGSRADSQLSVSWREGERASGTGNGARILACEKGPPAGSGRDFRGTPIGVARGLSPATFGHIQRQPMTNGPLQVPSGKPKREELQDSADARTPQGGAGNGDSEGSRTETCWGTGTGHRH